MATSRATKTADNRRVFERLPLSVPIFIRGVDEYGRKFIEFSTSVDISAGGLLVGLQRFLPVGSKVVIEIPVSQHKVSRGKQVGSPRNVIPARTIRSQSHHEHGQLVALKFHRPLCQTAKAAAPKAKSKSNSQ